MVLKVDLIREIRYMGPKSLFNKRKWADLALQWADLALQWADLALW